MIRAARHADVRAHLSALGDADLQLRVDSANVVGRGVGGLHRTIEVAGHTVFVKQVPLTQMELDHPRSTANLFGAPPEMHWGVRSVGLSAWRELAANQIATALFADARCLAVPLLHEWRVLDALPGPPITTWDGLDVAAMSDLWDGEPAVRRRMEAIATAPASLTMFSEYVPETVATWFARQAADTDEVFRNAFHLLLMELPRGIGELLINGIRHHDAHFANALIVDRTVLFSDLGLAASTQFDLDDAEREFLAATELHDIAYVLAHLVNAAIRERLELPDVGARYALVRSLAAGGAVPPELAPVEDFLTGIVAGVAVFNAWSWDLHGGALRTPFPADAIREAFAQ